MSDHNEPIYSEVNRDVVNSLVDTGAKYYITVAIVALIFFSCFLMPWFFQIYMGLGNAGLNHPNMWGTYLANFVFWIGLSHSGTLLSAIMHITQTPWRKAIYRSAEAMTLFSLMTAAMFPLVHVGRVWNIYWALPYPNQRGLWPDFRSPLLFDIMAISTYLTGSVLFIYMGSLPDFAAARDKTDGWRNRMYTVLSLGWRGTDKEWHRLGWAYTFFAVLIIPLAVSVHSIVSWDFAMSIVPGLHNTIFAPYFVVGAIYSGTAGIVTVMIVLRKFLCFEKYITLEHFNSLGKLLLVMSLLWTYINVLELFTGWFSGTSFELETLRFKLFGYYAPLYWTMIIFCAFAPLLMISKKFRTSITPMLILSIAINIGMYTERFLIIATSLPRKFLPDSWGFYFPSITEIAILIVSWFVLLFLIFVKIVPSVSIYEIKETLKLPRRSK
jgi:Ni/Fe-hydrogenase subunit HybB-like protein